MKELEEEAAWKMAQEANSEAGYRQYLSDYPKGRFAAPAKKALEHLRTAKKTSPSNSSKVEGTKSAAASRVYQAKKGKLELGDQVKKWLPMVGGALVLILLIWGISNISGPAPDGPEVTLLEVFEQNGKYGSEKCSFSSWLLLGFGCAFLAPS